MGPPSRPADKVERVDRTTDLNQLSDIVSASGIDVREEENYLAETYRNQQTINSSNSNPFTFQAQSNSHQNINSNIWSQPKSAGHGLPGTGPFNQPPVSMQTVEDELIEKHRKAARALAEQQQQHLRDPFLEVNTVRHRLAKRANQQGVGLNLEGLYDRVVDTPRTMNGTKITGADGTGIVAVQAPSILNENAPLVDIFTLISLATGERVRGLVEDAFGLSRGRQYGSHGLVPPEWSPLATGPGQPTSATAIPSSLTGTAWDRPPKGLNDVASENGVTGKYIDMFSNGDNMLTTIKDQEETKHAESSDPTRASLPTVSFTSSIPASLRTLAQADRRAEEARIAARTKRQKLANPNGEALGDNGAALVAPSEMKMTKKERERQARTGQTEEVLHKAANDAASMALGGFKKKQYSWLSGGRSSGASTPRCTDTGSGLNSPGRPSLGSSGGFDSPSQINNGSGPDAAQLRVRGRRYGEWREDGKRGKGIQIRDFILALEADGREKKSLARCLAKLRSSDF